jgi:hypothetical protein
MAAAAYDYCNPNAYAAWVTACVEKDRLKGRTKPRNTKNSQGFLIHEAAEGLLKLVSNRLRFSHFSPEFD